MGAIYKKELRSYVTSPVGYVVAAVLFALYGFYYYSVIISPHLSIAICLFGA